MGRSRTIELLRDVDDLPADDRQFVAALERGLRVVRMFSSAHETLSNGELSRGTALSKATISRLTYTLSRLGYLTHDSASGRYRLGPGALSLGYASLSKFDARQVARPLMQSLAEYAGASVALCARDGLNMIYLELRRSPNALGLGLDIGDRIPLATTSVGRAYLAALSDTERNPLLDDIRRSDPAVWPKVRRGIEQSVREVAERGYCLSLGDWVPEIHSVGVPLDVNSPYGTLALNIGGLASTLPPRLIESDLAPRLINLAHRVAEMLGAVTVERTVDKRSKGGR
jgi:DNA-binding IclR family transcriptional regulator